MGGSIGASTAASTGASPHGVRHGGGRRTREPRVARVGEEPLLQQPAPPEEPRSHGPHRHVQHRRRLLVRVALAVDEDDRGPERLAQVRERVVQRRAQADTGEQLVGAVADGPVVQHDRRQRVHVPLARVAVLGPTQALARREEGVVADGEQPPPAVRVGTERVPRAERAQEGVLHQVVGVGRVVRERARESVDRVEPRQRHPLEPGAVVRSRRGWPCL
jgi:hypothetical protein